MQQSGFSSKRPINRRGFLEAGLTVSLMGAATLALAGCGGGGGGNGSGTGDAPFWTYALGNAKASA